MEILALEGTVENGKIRLTVDVTLPERTKVHVIVPALRSSRPARIYGPRLANPKQAADFFLKEVFEAPPDIER